MFIEFHGFVIYLSNLLVNLNFIELKKLCIHLFQATFKWFYDFKETLYFYIVPKYIFLSMKNSKIFENARN